MLPLMIIITIVKLVADIIKITKRMNAMKHTKQQLCWVRAGVILFPIFSLFLAISCCIGIILEYSFSSVLGRGTSPLGPQRFQTSFSMLSEADRESRHIYQTQLCYFCSLSRCPLVHFLVVRYFLQHSRRCTKSPCEVHRQLVRHILRFLEHSQVFCCLFFFRKHCCFQNARYWKMFLQPSPSRSV